MPGAMPPYAGQSQQFPQGSYPARPQYPANYPAGGAQAGQPNVPNQNQYGGRPMPNAQFPGAYPQGGWGPQNAQPNMNHIQGKNGPASNAPTGSMVCNRLFITYHDIRKKLTFLSIFL